MAENTNAHTPGPWSVDTFGEDNMLGNWVKDAGGNALALIGHAQPNRVGNAHLIAAAPEMKEALKSARLWVALYHAHIANDPVTHPDAIANIEADRAAIDAAIAKAEGRS